MILTGGKIARTTTTTIMNPFKGLKELCRTLQIKCCWTPCSIQGAEVTHPRQPASRALPEDGLAWEAIASFIRRALDYLFPSSAT
jgi:hypothetical protein